MYYSKAEIIKRLRRFADKELAEEVLSNGFSAYLSGSALTRRKKRLIIKALKRAFEIKFNALLVSDQNFIQDVKSHGYAYAIMCSELAHDLCAIEPFGRMALNSVINDFANKDFRQKCRAEKIDRVAASKRFNKVRKIRPSDVRRFRKSQKAKLRNQKARANQKQKLAQVRQRPFDLVLVSQSYVDFEPVYDQALRDPLSKLGLSGSVSFSIHLGKYVGGQLSGPELTGGSYVGGVNLRIIGHYYYNKKGERAFRFKVKSSKPDRGQCMTWNSSQVRNIDHLPWRLQYLLRRELYATSPHLVQAIPKNVLRFTANT